MFDDFIYDDREYYFFYAALDGEKWLDGDIRLWKPEEAACLSLGLEPSRCEKGEAAVLVALMDLSNPDDALKNRLRVIKEAMYFGEIETIEGKISPIAFIKWAIEKEDSTNNQERINPFKLSRLLRVWYEAQPTPEKNNDLNLMLSVLPSDVDLKYLLENPLLTAAQAACLLRLQNSEKPLSKETAKSAAIIQSCIEAGELESEYGKVRRKNLYSWAKSKDSIDKTFFDYLEYCEQLANRTPEEPAPETTPQQIPITQKRTDYTQQDREQVLNELLDELVAKNPKLNLQNLPYDKETMFQMLKNKAPNLFTDGVLDDFWKNKLKGICKLKRGKKSE